MAHKHLLVQSAASERVGVEFTFGDTGIGVGERE